MLVLWNAPLVGAPPVQTTVCEILQKPSAFNGRIVQVKGTVTVGFETFSLYDGSCVSIWIDYAGNPNITPAVHFKLVRDANFAEFERRLAKGNTSLKVTLIGRLDGVDEIREKTTIRERQTGSDGTLSGVVNRTSTGFGHMGQYKARLVLKQVLAVGPTGPSQP